MLRLPRPNPGRASTTSKRLQPLEQPLLELDELTFGEAIVIDFGTQGRSFARLVARAFASAVPCARRVPEPLTGFGPFPSGSRRSLDLAVWGSGDETVADRRK